MLRLDEIKTGDRIVVRKSGILSFVEVVSTDAERISTDDGRIWNRDDGTCVFWQSHFAEGGGKSRKTQSNRNG